MNRASMTLFWLALTIIVSLGLYHTSYRVEELGQSLRALNHEIEAEQRSIHVLKAEYVFLTNPSRIEEAARKHLDLAPTKPMQIAQLSKLKNLVPTHREAIAASYRTAPIASLRPSAATHKPRAVAEESDRLNTHLIIEKTSQPTRTANERSIAMIGLDDTYSLAASGDEQ